MSELSDLLLRGVNLSNVDSRNLADALRRLERGLGSVLPPQGASGIGMTHGHTMDQISGGSSGSGGLAFGVSIQDVAGASNAGSGTAVAHDNHIHKLAVSAPLAWSGGTLQITQAGAGANGYLSSTDWNTFNSKQAALSFPLASTLGGTGINNAGKLTLATDAAITGGGTLALDGYTLTVPATGTAALATGLAGGQTINGGTGESEKLTLQSTSHGTKGKILLGSSTYYFDEAEGIFSLGSASPTAYVYVQRYDKVISADGTNNLYAFGGTIGKKINSGVTDSGTLYGMAFSVFRNYFTTSDNGTLTNLAGIVASYGHYLSDTSATPITTNAYGLRLTPYLRYGTITNLYGIYLNTANGSGATVTNSWGIYQASTYKNYLGGPLGIGVDVSSCRLTVKGSSTDDLQQWLNAAGSQVGKVDKDGVIQASGYKSSDGTAGWTGTVALAKLTSGGANGSLTVKNGLITAYTAPT